MIDVILQHCIPPDPALFFSKNDPHDPRMGDLTLRDAAKFPSSAGVALIGVPQDIGVTRNGGRIGAALAPDAVRAMLYKLTPYDPERNLTVSDGFLIDVGNVRCDGTLEEIHARVQSVVHVVCKAGLVPVSIGGGHDITYATVSGVHAALGEVGVLNFDAHLDVRKPDPLRNSGTSFRMLLEEDKVAANNFVEFGIQSFVNSADHVLWLESRGGRIMMLDEIRERGFATTLATAYLIASDGVGGLHGSLDMDAVRAADAPGVSAAMPEGFTASELLMTARLLGRRAETVSMDIVEINPNHDRDNITAKLAAHTVMQFLAGLGEREPMLP